jgi:hypothetical protein
LTACINASATTWMRSSVRSASRLLLDRANGNRILVGAPITGTLTDAPANR